jgi:hypothetical protein
MIPCVCIDDSGKPENIPQSKWVKRGEKYHITYSVICFPQKVLAFSIYEKPMDETCFPYQYFISTRFAVAPEDLEKLIELVNGCNDTAQLDLNELLKNSNLIEQ